MVPNSDSNFFMKSERRRLWTWWTRRTTLPETAKTAMNPTPIELIINLSLFVSQNIYRTLIWIKHDEHLCHRWTRSQKETKTTKTINKTCRPRRRRSCCCCGWCNIMFRKTKTRKDLCMQWTGRAIQGKEDRFSQIPSIFNRTHGIDYIC